MSTNICTIRILDEVYCVFVGLHPDHVGYFYEKYGVHAANYYFNPKFKLGSWDGKIRYFHKTGKTYVNLLEEIVPQVIGLGYKVRVDDQRTAVRVDPDPIDKDFFRDVKHPVTCEPWEMRGYQVDMVNTLVANGGGVGIAGTGAGKAETLDSLVLTTDGWVKMGDITTDHKVITPDNNEAAIVGIFPHENLEIFKVTFHDGTYVKCCGDHLWKVKRPKKLWRADTKWDVIDTLKIKEFIDLKNSKNRHIPGNISIPLCDPIEYRHVENNVLPIDPYVLGVILGDGNMTQPVTRITTTDDEIEKQLTEILHEIGIKLTPATYTKDVNIDYNLCKIHSYDRDVDTITHKLKKLGLHGCRSHEKFIPDIYKTSSIDDRWALVQGLMDTDGTAGKRNQSFCTTSEHLADDLQEVIQSLGGICTIMERNPTYTYNDEKREGKKAYDLHISVPTPKKLFRLTRKQERCRDLHGDGRIELVKRIKSVDLYSTEPAQCIMVDHPDHLYITDSFNVTHNTSMTAALAKIYENAANLRSIIIVPDKNLTDQTFREYQHFGLDVGEFSGDRKDMKHQHIVSTWQSLQNNPNFIQDFQVIIVDEAHGLRGNVLTKLLNEYGKDIPYRFGVTGTMPKAESDALAVKVAVGLVQYTIPAHELQEQGYLAKLQIDIIQHSINFKPQYQRYLEETDDPKPLTYRQFVDGYFPDYTNEKNYLQGHKERLEWIADYIKAKHELKRGNVLCLVNGVRFGKKLADLIPGAVFLSGKDKMKDRREVYQRFKDNDDVTVIATVQIASTGLDIPRIFNMISVDMGKSFVRTIQSIGRGLRKAADKDAVHFTDVCSDLKYSRKHLTERKKYYNEAKYSFKVHTVELASDN